MPERRRRRCPFHRAALWAAYPLGAPLRSSSLIADWSGWLGLPRLPDAFRGFAPLRATATSGHSGRALHRTPLLIGRPAGLALLSSSNPNLTLASPRYCVCDYQQRLQRRRNKCFAAQPEDLVSCSGSDLVPPCSGQRHSAGYR